MRRKKMKIIGCIFATLIFLVGNLMIFLKKFILVSSETRERTINNPILECINPGNYYDYPLDINYESGNINLMISLDNISEEDGCFIMLEIITDNYKSEKVSLNQLLNKWQNYSFKITNKEKVYLRFSIPSEVGNEASNLDLNFILKVKVNENEVAK